MLDIESRSIRAEVPQSTRTAWWTKDQWSTMGSVRSYSRRHSMGNRHCKYFLLIIMYTGTLKCCMLAPVSPLSRYFISKGRCGVGIEDSL